MAVSGFSDISFALGIGEFPPIGAMLDLRMLNAAGDEGCVASCHSRRVNYSRQRKYGGSPQQSRRKRGLSGGKGVFFIITNRVRPI